MNTELTKITGMIAVFDDAALNARLDYEVDTFNNKVTYTITCYWKHQRVYGKCPFTNYADAQLYFDGLPAVAEQELRATA